MAGYCADCTREVLHYGYEGMHDLPEGAAWYLCKGCGAHYFRAGYRICRTTQEEALGLGLAPCPRCLELAP